MLTFHTVVEIFSKQNIGLNTDKLSSTTVDFFRSEDNLT